ncbi:hypothetical protein HNR60_001982 [Rhodopseudomonas rhenobacensis]|uniref:Uncharacterized protein n=1 Tax=Rhodopseudomonas rhenobacensis TaxID=87461 RepID=A0A7W7Z3A1_9BRAD|nr:hypothetical protein [Rhodopseudomonas rhenobacensis]MBB5047230.1 hypothetical protein [Rhodopseudomonas rhenobacensis]
MASIDGGGSLAPPSCESCNAAMTLIGRLPRILLRPSVHVFRCFSCDNVISEEHRASESSQDQELTVPGV